MNKWFFLIVIASLVLSCRVKVIKETQVVRDTIYITRYKPVIGVNDALLMSVLWFQTSGEYKALCYQAYNVARWALDEAIKKNPGKTNLAVVFDIDETLLDNSPYEAKTILEGIKYPEGWRDWVLQAKAAAIPGAVAFANYARERGVHVFYISNRAEEEREATKQNLLAQGFPFQGEDHLLLKKTTSSKEDRRKQVAASYEIVLLIGDNLIDFSGLYDKKSCEERNQQVVIDQNLFGTKFIVLPNPMYGDWEGCLYNYNYNLKPAEIDSVRKSKLISY
ncbi:MAG: 5'-nucleotidase, lipoprotein e(P4) family [Bacteroidales bacterium]|nr:5'-nucleotidase, lipoprotein e(P4) family [Bacteroidales bacterium]